MNRNEFNRFISGGTVPGRGDLEEIRELTALFPWFNSAHLALLRGLKESSDIKFESQLKHSAIFISDREMLYDYLFLQPSISEVKEETLSPEVTGPEEMIRHDEVPVPENAAPGEPEVDLAEGNAQSDSPAPVTESEVMSDETEATVIAAQADLNTGVTQQDDTSLKTREELMAEIEARLNEITETVVMTPTQVDGVETSQEAIRVQAVTEVVIEGDACQSFTEEKKPLEELPAEPLTEHQPSDELTPSETWPESPEVEIKEKREEEPVSVTEESFILEEEGNIPAEAFTSGETFMEPGDEEGLLELIENDPHEEEPATKLSPADLIDRFIQTSPRIERMTIGDSAPVEDLSEASAEEKGSFITETLARIYLNQGYYSKAINIYEKLTLKYPEKSAYFASRIEKIKELLK